jgi:hypothetical protein
MLKAPSICALALLCGCAARSGAEQVGAAQPPAEVARPVLVAPPGFASRLPEQGVLVRLLDDGAEPRAPLTLTPELARPRGARVVMGMEMTRGLGGYESPPVPIPSMVLELGVTADAVDDGGRVQYTATLDGIDLEDLDGVNPGMADEVRKDLTALLGMRGEITVGPTGEPIGSYFEVPERASPDFQSQIETMQRTLSALSPPVPVEPVGVGARWEVLSRQSMGRLALAERALFELVSLEEGRAVVEVAIVQGPLNSEMSVDGLGAGAAARVIGFDASGRGRAEFVVGELVPARLEREVDARLELELLISGAAQQLYQTMRLTTSIQEI